MKDLLDMELAPNCLDFLNHASKLVLLVPELGRAD